MEWLQKFNLTIKNFRLDENNKSEKRLTRVTDTFPYVYKNNTTIKDTKLEIQLEQGHYPAKQDTRPVPLHLPKFDNTSPKH